MQSRDEFENVKQFVPVDLGNLPDLAAKVESAEEKGAVSHTIAQLPKAGDYVLIKGLRYKIEFADFVKGKFKVTLYCLDK